MSAGNAGEALRAFQIFPDMIGGRMKTEGRFDDSDPAHPLRAKLRVKSYQIVNTPILARLLGLLSLSGIRNALTGKGIQFSTLDMPLQARKGVISIDKGRAFGSALGLTFSGSVDTNAETLNIQGQVVPFYAVNSAIGHVPLVGDIMTGGEQGRRHLFRELLGRRTARGPAGIGESGDCPVPRVPALDFGDIRGLGQPGSRRRGRDDAVSL